MCTNSKIDQLLNSMKSKVNSQDPLDAVADELRIATRIKRFAEVRHKASIEALTNVLGEDKIEAVRDLARKNKFKSEQVYTGAVMNVLISCNAPSTRVDNKQFINELVKAGVNMDIIEKCMGKATKQSSPATTINAMEADA